MTVTLWRSGDDSEPVASTSTSAPATTTPVRPGDPFDALIGQRFTEMPQSAEQPYPGPTGLPAGSLWWNTAFLGERSKVVIVHDGASFIMLFEQILGGELGASDVRITDVVTQRGPRDEFTVANSSEPCRLDGQTRTQVVALFDGRVFAPRADAEQSSPTHAWLLNESTGEVSKVEPNRVSCDLPAP